MNSELEKLRKITETLTSNGYLIDRTKEWEYAFDAVPDNVFVVNPKFIVKFANKTLTKKLGVGREDIMGIPCYKMLGFNKPMLSACEDPADQCTECFNKAECEDHNGDICNFGNHIIPRLEGVYEFTRSAIKSETDKLLGYICVLRDVTEYRMINKSTSSLLKLHTLDCDDDEKLARFMLEEIVALTDSQVGYLHFVDDQGENDIRLDLFIWSKDTMKGCDTAPQHHYPLCDAGIWADSVRERRAIIHNDYPNQASENGLPEGHFPIKRHMSVPVFDNGKVVAVAGVGNKLIPYTDLDVAQTSITLGSMWTLMQKKSIERELSRREYQLVELTKLTKTAIYEIHFKTDRFTYVNTAMCEHTGYTKSELLNMKASSILTEESQLKLIGRLESFSRGEKVPNSVEYQGVTKDGSYIWVLCSIDFKIENGETVGARVVAIDVTEQRTLENKVKDILEASPFGVHMYKYEEDELIFIGSNSAADKILEIDNKIFVGLPIKKAFPELVTHGVPDRYIEVMRTGKTWSAVVDYEDDKLGGAFEVHAFKTSDNTMAAMFTEIGANQVLRTKVDELKERLSATEFECKQLAEYLTTENNK